MNIGLSLNTVERQPRLDRVLEHIMNCRAMVRRSVPQQTLAEWYFPIRVRVAVPPGGFGAQIDHMHAWLNQHAGPASHFVGSETRVGMADAAVIYFMDAKVAAEFVERFACELLAGREPPSAERSPVSQRWRYR